MGATLEHLGAVMRLEEECEDHHYDDLALLAAEYRQYEIDLSDRLAKGSPGERLFVDTNAGSLDAVAPMKPSVAVELWAADTYSVVRVSKDADSDIGTRAVELFTKTHWGNVPGIKQWRGRQTARLASAILAGSAMNITEFERFEGQIDHEIIDDMRKAETGVYLLDQKIRQRTKTGYDIARKGMRPDVYLDNNDEEIPLWQAHSNGFEMAMAVGGMRRALAVIRGGDLITPAPLWQK